MTDEDKNEKAARFGDAEAKQLWGTAYTADKEIEKLEAEVERLKGLMLKVHAKQVAQEIKRDEARAKEKQIRECAELLRRPQVSFDMHESNYKQKMTAQRRKMSEYTGTDTFL